MTYALDAILIHAMGAVNMAVFRISRGRVVLHRFSGTPGARLTEIGDLPELDPPSVGYLRDGDDYVLLVPARTSEPGWLRDVRNATSVTLEIQHGTECSAVAMVGKGEVDTEAAFRERVHSAGTQRIRADVLPVVGEAEQSKVLARLLKGASLDERYDVRKEHLVPVARLKARQGC